VGDLRALCRLCVYLMPVPCGALCWPEVRAAPQDLALVARVRWKRGRRHVVLYKLWQTEQSSVCTYYSSPHTCWCSARALVMFIVLIHWGGGTPWRVGRLFDPLGAWGAFLRLRTSPHAYVHVVGAVGSCWLVVSPKCTAVFSRA
jgi:hypothetical protein